MMGAGVSTHLCPTRLDSEMCDIKYCIIMKQTRVDYTVTDIPMFSDYGECSGKRSLIFHSDNIFLGESRAFCV